jgi:transposase
MGGRHEAFVVRAPHGASSRARSRRVDIKAAEFAVSDALWAQVERLLPPYLLKPGAGRPPLGTRRVFEAVVYVLRTGSPWKSLPKKRFGSATSIHKRFLEWEGAGFFAKLWREGLAEHEELEGIPWRWHRPTPNSSVRAWSPAVRHRRNL